MRQGTFIPGFQNVEPTLSKWNMEGSLDSYRPLLLCPQGDFFFFKELIFFLFICFWLRWVFVAEHGLSLVAASRGYSSLRCAGFSLQWLLLLQSTGSRRAGFSSCGTQAQQLWLAGSRAQAQQLWCTGLAAPRHVGSSQTRARTRVPCTGRRILNHCATEEAALKILYIYIHTFVHAYFSSLKLPYQCLSTSFLPLNLSLNLITRFLTKQHNMELQTICQHKHITVLSEKRKIYRKFFSTQNKLGKKEN